MKSIEETSNHIEIVKSLVGESISSLSNCQYHFNGKVQYEDFGDLEILTTSGLEICFKLLTDGESVGAYKRKLNIPSSFEVAKGETASWDRLLVKQSSAISGEKIVSIYALYDYWPKQNPKTLAGWRVNISNGEFFVFFNNGDNAIFLFNKLPPEDDFPDIEKICEQI